MKKKIVKLLFLSAMLTACGNNKTSTSLSAEEESATASLGTAPSEAEEVVCDEQDHEVKYLDYDEQIEVLTDHFAEWRKKSDKLIGDYSGYPHMITVADLNRNGRLEVIRTVHLSLGNECATYTVFFEVGEDFDSVDLIKTSDGGEFDYYGADFGADVPCYKKGDTYYYEVEDYVGLGCDAKELYYYSYSFDGEIKSDIIGGVKARIVESYISPGKYNYTDYVGFYDNKDSLFSSEVEFDDHMEEYWEGYERQSDVYLKWVAIPTNKGNCKDKLQKSLEGYDEAASEKDTLVDYKKFISDFFGHPADYIIVTE